MDDFLDEMQAAVPSLRRYARALTRDAERADDLVQDCLERALRKRSLWRPTGPLVAWLFRVPVNIYRNDFKTRRREPAAASLDDGRPEAASAPPQLDRLALADTARAIDRLPDEQREALLLVVLEGISHAEAAERLAIPVGTLMSRLGRARAQLRKDLDNPAPRLRAVK